MPKICDQPEYCRRAEDAAEAAVKKVFVILGVDVNDPVQVEEFRKSLRFGDTLRKLRDRAELAMVAIISSGLVGLVAYGASQWIKNPPH